MLFVCHPNILQKHCFQFLLGVKMAPRETENNASAKCWGDKHRALQYVMVFSGVVNIVYFVNLNYLCECQLLTLSRASHSETSCDFYFRFFFQSDRLTQYQETHLMLRPSQFNASFPIARPTHFFWKSKKKNKIPESLVKKQVVEFTSTRSCLINTNYCLKLSSFLQPF